MSRQHVLVWQKKKKEEQQEEEQVDFEEEIEYDFLPGGEANRVFEIKLGTSDCLRFSCACHKNNLAVRSAIQNNKQLANILALLSRYAKNIRRSLVLV